MDDLFAGAPIISAYTRAQAIEDGVLRDAGDAAREAGFRFPFAMTAAVWADCVAWDGAADPTDQEKYRLRDVLEAVRQAVAKAQGFGQHAPQRIPVMALKRTHKENHFRAVDLALVVGPGDSGEPVLTLMGPNED